MYKILVTDGGYSHSLGIIRSLNKAGHIVDCIGHKLCLSSFSKFLNKVSYKQSYFKSEHITKFIKFLKIEKYDFLIPIGANSVSLVSKYREEISKYTTVNLAPKKSINKCLSKADLLNLAKKLNVPIPNNFQKDDFIKSNPNCKFLLNKYVVKPASELSNSKIIYTSNLKKILKVLKLKENFLIQEYINGYGVGFFAIYDNGVMKDFFMHRRIRENPPSGGSSVCAESIFDEKLFLYGKKILDELKWHGVAMVEFKKEFFTDKLYLMEVNPKFWASHDLAIISGLNFAEKYLEIKPGSFSLEKNIEYKIKYKLNTKFQWLARDLSSSILYPIRLLKVLYYYLILKAYNNLNLNDPLCTLYLLIYAFFSPLAKLKIFKKFYTFFYRIKTIGLKITLIRTFSETIGIEFEKYSKINKNIYVGSSPSKLGLFILEKRNFKYILNLRINSRNYKFINNLIIFNLPVEEFTSPSLSQLKVGTKFINEAIINNKKIFIHCREGVSRAPCFLIAYFIKYHKKSFKSSLNLIKKTRPFIKILPSQEKILIKFEKLNIR